MKRVALVGSRDFVDYDNFKQKVDSTLESWGITPKEVVVVSGGAKGTDTLAEKYAKEETTNKPLIFKPDWKTHGKKAGILRNGDIIEAAEYCIAFPSENGKGTQDSMKRATAKKIPLQVFWV